MPELPEVETIRRGLAKRITGDRIESVWLSDKPQPFKCAPQEIAATLEGAHVRGVRRMGKHLVIDLERNPQTELQLPDAGEKRCPGRGCGQIAGGHEAGNNAHSQWIVHLGMTGSMQVVAPSSALLKHTHAVARLASGREIRFVDPRRFGRMWVTSNFETCGIEPLHISDDEFSRLFRGRKTPIKSALLNQKLLRGVGNIYADEALFRAGIRPRRRAGSLAREDLRRLWRAVQRVLKEAIIAGGSSISDYFDVEGKPGLFQTRHRVYGREGSPCLVCRTAIKRIVIAGRGTHYCPKCQR
jgi:formamidopyrimidine-DNA glycosylase